MIKKQLEQIKKDAINDKENDCFREVAIWLKDMDESVNITVDEHFEFEVSENWLFVRYNNGDIDEPYFFNHTFNLSEVIYITDEV